MKKILAHIWPAILITILLAFANGIEFAVMILLISGLIIYSFLYCLQNQNPQKISRHLGVKLLLIIVFTLLYSKFAFDLHGLNDKIKTEIGEKLDPKYYSYVEKTDILTYSPGVSADDSPSPDEVLEDVPVIVHLYSRWWVKWVYNLMGIALIANFLLILLCLLLMSEDIENTDLAPKWRFYKQGILIILISTPLLILLARITGDSIPLMGMFYIAFSFIFIVPILYGIPKVFSTIITEAETPEKGYWLVGSIVGVIAIIVIFCFIKINDLPIIVWILMGVCILFGLMIGGSIVVSILFVLPYVLFVNFIHLIKKVKTKIKK